MECLVSSQRIRSEFFKTSIARKVISFKLPIGVETMYKPLTRVLIIMKKKISLILTYLLIFLNCTTFGKASEDKLKIGLLVPFSGEYKELGNSFLYSVQLALEEIGDENITIIPRDSGSNEPEKLDKATKEIISEGAKVIIGPINYNETKNVYKFNNIVFISPSNLPV